MEEEKDPKNQHYEGLPFTQEDLARAKKEKEFLHSRSLCLKGGCPQCCETVSDR